MQEKITVCFIQSFTYSVFNPKSGVKIGGAEVDLYNIATELARDIRFDVYFIVADFGQKNLEIFKNVKVIKGHSLEKSLKNYIYGPITFVKNLALINADIYLTASTSKFIFFTNLYCKLFYKIHIHRTEHQNQVNRIYNLKKALKLNFRYIFFLLGFFNVDHIIVQNEEDKQKLQRSYGFPSTVIKNSYRIPEKNDNKREFILWIARCVSWKRAEIFLELAKQFPNEKFVMIAPISFEPDYFETIKTKAEKIGNLNFIPGVPFSEVEEYYKKAKIFVNTSLSEGFPNSFNQAMNYSTPILSLKINPDDFIRQNEVGIYANDNFMELKGGLKLLLNDQELWNRLSNNAYKFVLSEMNIEKDIKTWKKIFRYFYNIKHVIKNNN